MKTGGQKNCRHISYSKVGILDVVVNSDIGLLVYRCKSFVTDDSNLCHCQSFVNCSENQIRMINLN